VPARQTSSATGHLRWKQYQLTGREAARIQPQPMQNSFFADSRLTAGQSFHRQDLALEQRRRWVTHEQGLLPDQVPWPTQRCMGAAISCATWRHGHRPSPVTGPFHHRDFVGHGTRPRGHDGADGAAASDEGQLQSTTCRDLIADSGFWWSWRPTRQNNIEHAKTVLTRPAQLRHRVWTGGSCMVLAACGVSFSTIPLRNDSYGASASGQPKPGVLPGFQPPRRPCGDPVDSSSPPTSAIPMQFTGP